jgi:hypothetical protein
MTGGGVIFERYGINKSDAKIGDKTMGIKQDLFGFPEVKAGGKNVVRLTGIDDVIIAVSYKLQGTLPLHVFLVTIIL